MGVEKVQSEPVLELRGIEHQVADGGASRRVLHGVDLRLDTGEFVAITGPSGAGKTTLLRIAAGLQRPHDGVVAFRSVDVYAQRSSFRSKLRRREIGFVFQEHNLLEMLSALENVSLALELDGVPVRRARPLAQQALDRVGIGALARRFPPQMSGGERQRVAIARAIVGDRPLLLADEPTGALDSATGAEVIAVIEDLCRTGGTTALLVTHNKEHAERADRVVQIVDGGVHT